MRKGLITRRKRKRTPGKALYPTPYNVDMKSFTSLMKFHKKVMVQEMRRDVSALNMPHGQMEALQGNETEKKLEDLLIHPKKLKYGKPHSSKVTKAHFI
jgi:hypothetical protein